MLPLWMERTWCGTRDDLVVCFVGKLSSSSGRGCVKNVRRTNPSRLIEVSLIWTCGDEVFTFPELVERECGIETPPPLRVNPKSSLII